MRTYKIRLLPTKEQEILLWKHINVCRFIWNWGLAIQIKTYEETGKKLNGFALIKMLTQLKKQTDFQWLNDVNNASLQNVLKDLEQAYVNFFGGNGFGHPKFKSKKRARPVFPTRAERVYFKNELVTIPNVGKMSYQTNYTVPSQSTKIYNARIGYVNNKWILRISLECENQAPVLTDKSMGIDLGVKDLCNVAIGEDNIVVKNINKTQGIKRKQKKLKRLQRKVSRKYGQNGNYNKTQNILKVEQQIRELYYHISCIRKNHIHQTTHMLVSKLPKRVVMENLNVGNLIKNRHLAKAIQEQGFFEFRRQMQYKCEWNGIEFVLADRFYPSSKTCSNCGNIKKDLKLSDRTYKCSECGLVIDRDYNAAINLMKYAE